MLKRKKKYFVNLQDSPFIQSFAIQDHRAYFLAKTKWFQTCDYRESREVPWARGQNWSHFQRYQQVSHPWWLSWRAHFEEWKQVLKSKAVLFSFIKIAPISTQYNVINPLISSYLTILQNAKVSFTFWHFVVSGSECPFYSLYLHFLMLDLATEALCYMRTGNNQPELFTALLGEFQTFLLLENELIWG